MMGKLSIKDVKQLDLVDFLASLGYQPQKIQGHQYWYCSPLRQEQTASFKVDRRLNLWYDHGQGQGGTIIDLGITLFSCNIAQLLDKMEAYSPPSPGANVPARRQMAGEVDGESKIEIVSRGPILQPALVQYISARHIPMEIASRFCQQISYLVGSRQYFALGFENDKGGLELRSPGFKGGSTPKHPTTIKGTDAGLLVFEGFFDYLSFLSVAQYIPMRNHSSLILNSLSFLIPSVPQIRQYSPVVSLFDNDLAGERGTALLVEHVQGATDGSGFYSPFHDINDWLIQRSNTHHIRAATAQLRGILPPELLLPSRPTRGLRFH